MSSFYDSCFWNHPFPPQSPCPVDFLNSKVLGLVNRIVFGFWGLQVPLPLSSFEICILLGLWIISRHFSGVRWRLFVGHHSPKWSKGGIPLSGVSRDFLAHHLGRTLILPLVLVRNISNSLGHNPVSKRQADRLNRKILCIRG